MSRQWMPGWGLCLYLLLLPVAMATAQEGGSAAAEPVKELSGISIVGNDEAPKSLYIVPWKSSEIGDPPQLHMMLDDRGAPVDREVFLRQLDFYEARTAE